MCLKTMLLEDSAKFSNMRKRGYYPRHIRTNPARLWGISRILDREMLYPDTGGGDFVWWRQPLPRFDRRGYYLAR
jgi:hypothetical protein